MAAPTYQTTAVLDTFLWLAVTTSANTVVTVPDADIAIKHTGLQADDTSATVATVSATTDFIVVTDNADTVATQDLDPGSAAGSTAEKLVLFAGDSDGFRGYDMVNVSGLKKIKIKAVGHTAYVKLVRGSTFGCEV